MTALLSCDGCGQIVSERPDDPDPTAKWWSLSLAPSIGGAMLLPEISFEVAEEYDDGEVVALVPDRHFCALDCLRAWVLREVPE